MKPPTAPTFKETAMLKRKLVRSFVCASAVTICSNFVLSAVFAADFPVGSYEAGDLRLTFDDKGQFHVNKGATTEVSGKYSVKGGQIELTDVKGPWACTNAGQQTGTYDWKFDSSALTFSKVADSCDDRSGTLLPAAWKRGK
jgi:hypothetical protein